MKIIKCPHCSTQNRVGVLSTRQQAACGRCGRNLPGPASSGVSFFLAKYKYWLILGAIIGAAYISESSKSEVPAQYTPPSTYRAPTEPVFNAPIVPIGQGVQGVYTHQFLVAPLSITTPHGEENYFVKIVDAASATPVLTLFIYGGQTFKLNVPLGAFKLKYATGKNWFGEANLFGPSTSFNEADTTLFFHDDGNQINGYTIKLIKQRDGNLHTKAIDRNQF